MPSPRALFFDVGDTLVFDRPALTERLRLALQSTRIADPSSEDLEAAVRVGERIALAHYLDGIDWAEETALRPATQAILSALGVAELSDTQWSALRKQYLSVPFGRYACSGSVGLLTQLRERGFRLGIISDWDDTLESVLTECGLRPFFRTVTASYEVGHTKPHAVLFDNALQQMNADPAECLHIGDWYELDVRGAKAVGMDALLFDHVGRAPDAPCRRITTFAALAETLLALPYDL